jgi:hypothetical protein
VEHGAHHRRAIKAVKAGKFKAEDYGHYSTMKYKGSELAPLGTFEKKVPADCWPRCKAKEKAILDGKFTVKVDDGQPKSTQVTLRAGPAPALDGITKRFGALVANDGISLTLQRGRGAGAAGRERRRQVTLVSILFGHYVADEGRITVDGQPLPPGNPARRAGRGHRHGAPALHAGRQPERARQRAAGHRAAVAAVLAPRAPRARGCSTVPQRFGLQVDPDARSAACRWASASGSRS